jgi:hypothetical protein
MLSEIEEDPTATLWSAIGRFKTGSSLGAALLTEASATDKVRRANFTNFIWIIYLN